MTTLRNTAITQATRSRDGGICQCCGRAGDCEVHHIQPLYLGGDDTLSNTICLCSLCHEHAPDDPAQFLAYQRDGGAFVHFLRELVTDAQNDALAMEATTCLHAWKRRVVDGGRPIDEFRWLRWGWSPGRSLPMQSLHTGTQAVAVAARELLDRVSRASSQIYWRLALQGDEDKIPSLNDVAEVLFIGLDGKREICRAVFLSECLRRLRGYRQTVATQLEKLDNHPLPISCLALEFNSALGDLETVCVEELAGLTDVINAAPASHRVAIVSLSDHGWNAPATQEAA